VLLDPSVMVSLMSMMVLEGWQFRLASDLSVFNNVKIAVGGFGAGVFLKNFKARLLGKEKGVVGADGPDETKEEYRGIYKPPSEREDAKLK
jgi:hypothetical protein